MEIGRSIHRVDALDKVTGRAKYTDDLRGQGVLVARILHSTIANGVVKEMDLTEAQKVPGVVKILTCFDVPDIQYPIRTWPTGSCWPSGCASTGRISLWWWRRTRSPPSTP